MKITFKKIAVCFLIFILFSCSSLNLESRVVIAVVGINDFHGNLLPKDRKLADGRIVQSGGASAFASMVKILREEMKGRVLIIDAGDEWQGTLESNRSQGNTVVKFFNQLGVNVAAIGNHEFDFSLENLKTRAKEAKYGYVASNIYEKKNKKRVNWDNVLPSRMLEVDGIKFGVIGVSTTFTPGTTRYEYVKHLDFVDPTKPVQEEAKKLREQGANAVLVTSHAGVFCKESKQPEQSLRAWTMRFASSVQGECEEHDEIYKLAKNVGPHTLDGMVVGHTHQITHHWLNGIPSIQDEAYNQFFNIIYFTFDKTTRRLLPELTRIEGLIPICTQFFKGTQHCDVRRLSEGQSLPPSPQLEQAYFHSKPIIADAETEEYLKPIIEETNEFRKQVLVTSELPLTHFRDKEGALENLMSDVMQQKSKADFVMINSGGIRTPLESGPMTYADLFRAIPFDNLLNVIRLKGKDVRLFYEIATAGNHGFVGVSGLKLKLLSLDKPAVKRDLNHDGLFEPWEENRLLDITLSDDSPLIDSKTYKLATFDFIVNGGDDMQWFMKRVSQKNIIHDDTIVRDLIKDYLLKIKVINTREHPLVDPAKPRLIVVEG